MDEQAKKTALRMIPYGLYILTAKDGQQIASGAINWVTQASFQPPLVVMGVKTDSALYPVVTASRKFALSILGTGQKDLAFAFFKHQEPSEGRLGDYAFETHTTGAPIISDAPAWVEGDVVEIVERGDHAIVIGEVTEAGVKRESAPLTLEECGVKYGG
ncbi:MAG TPA: flavin reductase family protein [Dehalococcoidia bacterium]|nr:flavin reductase family protein [Dehalococcoidia bacterium]